MKRMWLFLVPMLISCSGGIRESRLLPDRLHGYPLVEAITGEEAAEMIERLHAKSVAPVASEIGTYGSFRPPLLLYVSRFRSGRQALDQVALMADTIGPGRSGFGHHQVEEVAGVRIHHVIGHGQTHYFFADEDRVLWLASPAEAARPAMLELLGKGDG